MKTIRLLIVLSICCLILCPGLLWAEEGPDGAPVPSTQPDAQVVQSGSQVAGGNSISTEPDDEYSDYYESEEIQPIISDPLEPVNRAFFVFNDRLYFWVLKPVSKGYRSITPSPIRVGIKNFFSNLGFPIRFVNCLLQAKFTGAGNEFERFFINSTLGLGGFIDMAEREFKVKAVDEDFGQTLGRYGLGQGFYINWPFLGPSSALDTIGLAGDYLLEPTYYLDMETKYKVGIKGVKIINNTSLSLGDYETLKDSALDPYISLRDFYIQYRQKKIKE